MIAEKAVKEIFYKDKMKYYSKKNILILKGYRAPFRNCLFNLHIVD